MASRSFSLVRLRRRERRMLWEKRAFVPSSGSRYASPPFPSSAARRPSHASKKSSPAITTAGMPMVRASWAAWAFTEPWAVINPKIRLRSSKKISVGYISCAAMMAGPESCKICLGLSSSASTTR